MSRDFKEAIILLMQHPAMRTPLDELSYEEQIFTVFKPFCVSQNYNDNNLIISNTILCEVDSANYCNKGHLKWICTDDLRAMLVDHQENISAHNIAALKLFCNL